MAAGARRVTLQGAEGDEEGDGGDGVHDVRLDMAATSAYALRLHLSFVFSPCSHLTNEVYFRLVKPRLHAVLKIELAVRVCHSEG